MVEIAAGYLSTCRQHVLTGGYRKVNKWEMKLKKKQEWKCLYAATEPRRKQPNGVKNQIRMEKPATYTARLSTDIPLYESPRAPFDRYLEDKSRVFQAIFPDKRRSRQLNKEEWRIQMLPINFLFLTVWPIVDMKLRCKTGGIDYPPEVPGDISKVLELGITRWELQGLDDVFKPSKFSLGVKGLLYSDRRGTQTRLKGQLEMKISCIVPPVIALVPEDVRRNVAESILTRLVENMKHEVNGSLTADYAKFKRESLRNTN